MFWFLCAATAFTAYMVAEDRRADHFKEFLRKEIHKQDGKSVNIAQSKENFENSWFWDYNFDSMIVED